MELELYKLGGRFLKYMWFHQAAFREKKREAMYIVELTLSFGDRVLSKLEAELTVWGL